MHQARLNRLLHWFGSALSLFAVVFVAVKLQEYGSGLDISDFTFAALPLLGLSIVYGAANVLLALAWRDLLRHFGESTSIRFAVRTYGISQLAKYVPGNVFHFVGRQALGVSAGLPAWPLAKSSLWELGALAATGATFIVLVLPRFDANLSPALAVSVFGLTTVVAAWISSRWLSPWIARVIAWDLSFLALSGLIFLAVLLLVERNQAVDETSLLMVAAAYVVAWLAGFLTPGAPAGVGIREFVLFAALQSIVSETDLLSAILIARMVTVTGDVLFYLLALTIEQRAAGLD